jgi:hypothetical protein
MGGKDRDGIEREGVIQQVRRHADELRRVVEA